jgi:hypothetical protein
MKTIRQYGVIALLATLPLGVQAGQAKSEKNHDERWSGAVTSVNTANKSVTGTSWLASKTFNLGENCAIVTLDKKEGSLADLRPGDKIKVHYRDVEGVLVADRIAERPLHYSGRVHAINEQTRTLTMHEPALYQPFHAPEKFRLAADCKVVLGNGRSGTLASIQPGDRITVIYELPGSSPVAYRIRDESLDFVGKLDAMDLSTRTLRAKERDTRKSFDVADHCQIILRGKQNGRLKDLALGDEYRFTYQTVNGLNVVDRIAPVQATTTPEASSAG